MTNSISRRLLAAVAALALGAGSSEAQASAEAVPTAGNRAAPAPLLTGSGPNGATIRCRDGSYPAPMAADAACESKGGVLVRFPMKATPQPVAAPARPPQATTLRAERDTTRPEGFKTWRERRAEVEAEERAQRPPEGATLRCGDGSWVLRDTSSVRCATRGGVSIRLEQPAPRRGL